MFAFICGEVCGVGNGTIILKNNDIGYLLHVSDFTLADCGVVGKKVQLFTYFHVKEDGVSLYGFKTEAEKELFLKLTSVSGVGAKLAMTVLGGFKTEHLLKSIISGDVATLSTIKGIGKKTAERLVLELKEKISAAELFVSKQDDDRTFIAGGLGKEAQDAVEALILLGFQRAAAEKAVRAAVSDGINTAEEIIKSALKRI